MAKGYLLSVFGNVSPYYVTQDVLGLQDPWMGNCNYYSIVRWWVNYDRVIIWIKNLHKTILSQNWQHNIR